VEGFHEREIWLVDIPVAERFAGAVGGVVSAGGGGGGGVGDGDPPASVKTKLSTRPPEALPTLNPGFPTAVMVLSVDEILSTPSTYTFIDVFLRDSFTVLAVVAEGASPA
jgi:hypothetical protein